MNCPRCGTQVPQAGHFCFVCGNELASQGNRRSFVAKPDESVRSFKIVSSLMPRGAAERPRTYQIALGIALLATVLAAVLGAVPIALLLAAFSIPVVYIVYLYDVNLWEDEPVSVTALAFALTFVLATAFTIAWTALRGPLVSSGTFGTRLAPTLTGILIAALLVPVVGELLRQVGPVILASRPKFDDLMDGLTFGVISGVAYSTADTLVKNWDLMSLGFHGVGTSSFTWVTLLVLEGFIKPLVIGTATGIAGAEFSGLGRGYDGLTQRYLLAVVEAIGWNILYFAGTYLLSFVVPPAAGLGLSIVWGLLLLGALLIRVRGVLQIGLLEAALESAARSSVASPAGAEGDLQFCASCEMPLMPGAAFCANCGLSVATASRSAVVQVAAASLGEPGAAGAEPAPRTGEPATVGTASVDPAPEPPASQPSAGEEVR